MVNSGRYVAGIAMLLTTMSLRSPSGPTRDAVEPATVRIFPSSSVLPENLLKFYLEFPRPMREGEAARSITLRDEYDSILTDAFLGLDLELWNANHRRLTVMLDPGRIKRGLRPNQELGSPLVPGRRYRLEISGAWRDAEGRALGQSVAKEFVAGPAERKTLDASGWTVRVPEAGSTAPVTLVAPVSLDMALARRMTELVRDDGAEVSVRIQLDNHERVVQFIPSQGWKPGKYQILLDARLEDLAGNSFQRPFDADLEDRETVIRDDLLVVRIPLQIEVTAEEGCGSWHTPPGP